MAANPKHIAFNILHRKGKENSIAGGFIQRVGYKCIECGSEVSPASVRWYEGNGLELFERNLKCYKCQMETRTPAEKYFDQ